MRLSDKALTTAPFTVSYGGNKFRATLPEALYDDLCPGANQFLHGTRSPRRASLSSVVDYIGLTDVARCCSMPRWSHG